MRVQRYTVDGLVAESDVPDVPEVVNADALRDRIAQNIATLEDASDNWGTLTAAQRTAAMGVAVRTVARIARLILNRLDAAP